MAGGLSLPVVRMGKTLGLGNAGKVAG
jgi:hypothetical protein